MSSQTPIEFAKRNVVNGEFTVLELEAADAGHEFIYQAQQRVGDAVVRAFADGETLMMTMVAPMQWGKTGVMAAVARGLVNHPTKPIHPTSVYIITGMSDNDWRNQTQERFPKSWSKNVMHRCELEGDTDEFADMKNALFIIDECHFGAQADGLVDKFFQAIGIKSVSSLIERNVRIFQTSATPDNVLMEANLWNQEGKPRYHEMIVPNYHETDTYVSLERIVREGRVLESETLYDSGATEFGEAVMSFSSPKWHILRLPSGPKSKAKQVGIFAAMNALCKKYDWDEPVKHFGTSRMADTLLSSPPEKHTVIYIKGLLRAAKTLTDTNIGVVYETFGENKSDSSEAQGLPGRLCGHGKRTGHGAPILFCNTSSIHNYIGLMESSFNYTMGDLEFKSCTIRKRQGEEPIVRPSMFDPAKIDGIEMQTELQRPGERNTPAAHVSPVFATIDEARKWSKINGFGGIRARSLNSAGYYESPIPKDGEMVHLVCDRDELDVRGVHLTKQSPKRLLGFYEDKDDTATLRFIINYRKYE